MPTGKIGWKIVIKSDTPGLYAFNDSDWRCCLYTENLNSRGEENKKYTVFGSAEEAKIRAAELSLVGFPCKRCAGYPRGCSIFGIEIKEVDVPGGEK